MASQDSNRGGNRTDQPRPPTLPLSPPLLTLDRQSLSLVLQHLHWRDKLLQLTRLCRALPALDPVDLSYDQVLFKGRGQLDWGWHLHRQHWAQQWLRCNRSDRLDTFFASPRLLRLFSHVYHLAFQAGEEPLPDSARATLCPPSPTAPSAFSRLRVLELTTWGEVTTFFERLVPSSAAFPSLEHLAAGREATSEEELTPALDHATLLPLSRLPRLRLLSLMLLSLTLDGFFFICSLPLTRLDLSTCTLITTATAVASAPVTVASTWQQLLLPLRAVQSNLVAYAAACVAALAGYADSIAASAHSATARQSMLQRLVGGWDVDVRCMQVIARIPSLMDLAATFLFPRCVLTSVALLCILIVDLLVSVSQQFDSVRYPWEASRLLTIPPLDAFHVL